MCTVCGCSARDARIEGAEPEDGVHAHRHADGTVHVHAHSHDHGHVHGHARAHARGDVPADPFSAVSGVDALHYGTGPARSHVPGLSQARMVRIEQDILARNGLHADANRRLFERQGVLALNLMSSPGSGKTTLLTATIDRLRDRVPIAVIEGDQQTSNDAERIRATGVPAIQVNTGKGCHLDAGMVARALEHLGVPAHGLLLIENVGNLVCPSGFDLGEAHKVVILSVTEGEDKPLKYPDIFNAADIMVLNKVDLLPHVDFDVAVCTGNARRVNPGIRVLSLSATTGQGMTAWIDWLLSGVRRPPDAQAVSPGRQRQDPPDVSGGDAGAGG